MTIVLLFAVVCFAAAAVSLAQTLGGRRQLRASLDRAAGIAAGPPTLGLSIRGRRLPLVGRLARLALAVRPGAERDEIALRLAAAGLARRVSPDAYLALQGALLVGSVGVMALALAGGLGGGAVMLGLVGIACSILLPDRLLRSLTARRREAILAELPGALDLLSVCVEAGLGFDAALTRVAAVIEGPLSQEFTSMLTEIRIGEARTVALQRLAERVDVPDLTAFARAVARADQLGVSLAQALRVQAADARARRQVAAEERANKAPVKLLMPTTLFIFPALFVVVLGPAVLTFARFLG